MERHIRYATYASVSVALFLVMVKCYAWAVTGSVSLLSSLADSALDALASLINLVAVHYALVPPDDDHRFGHTGAEDVAALFQALFISVSSGFVGYRAFDRLMHPVPLEAELVGILVMLVSIAFTVGLVLYQRFVVRHSRSVAIHADSFHYMSDILVNLSVITALVLVKYLGLPLADPLIGLGIAAYILFGALKIGKAAIDRLMDKEFGDEERKKVEEVIRGSKGVLGMHDLKTRYSGPKAFIQCHVEMDGTLSLKEAHGLGDAIERRLMEAVPHADVLIHLDPHVPGKKL